MEQDEINQAGWSELRWRLNLVDNSTIARQALEAEAIKARIRYLEAKAGKESA